MFGRKFTSKRKKPLVTCSYRTDVLPEPVPEVFEFRPADWPEKCFSGQSVRRTIRATLSPSYTKRFFLHRRGFQKKDATKPKKSQAVNMGGRKLYSSINFHEGIS